MIRHRAFSALLLLNGQLAADAESSSSAIDDLDSNTKRAFIRTPAALNPGTAFTIVYKDNRQPLLDEAQCLATVRVNGRFVGVGVVNGQFGEQGDGEGTREEPSVSGVIGPGGTQPTTISLSIKLLNKPGGGDHVVFEFVLLPPVDTIEVVPASCDPRDVSPALTPLQQDQYDIRNHSQYENPLQPQLHVQPAQWAELNAQLKAAKESAEYFEATTAKFWQKLPPAERIDYLEERLRTNEISAAMRVSIAVARNDAVREVEKAKQEAIRAEVESIKKFYVVD